MSLTGYTCSNLVRIHFFESHLTHPYAGIIQIRVWDEVVNFLSACCTSSPVINPYKLNDRCSS